MLRRILQVGMLIAVMGGGAARAEIIDRVLAVVDGTIITQSDVLGAMRLGILPGPAGRPVDVALDRLIQRRLILAEVDRYAPPDPSDADVEKAVADIRRRFTAAELDALLAGFGITPDQLRRLVRDNLRIESYLQQRFGSAFQQPTEDEVLQYYQAHQKDFIRGGAARAFDDAHDDARAALVAERRAAQIQEWIDGLRRRANVNVLLAITGR